MKEKIKNEKGIRLMISLYTQHYQDPKKRKIKVHIHYRQVIHYL